MLRKAEIKDIARIAEIIIFTKRDTYRPIFRNDNVSFNEMQVVNEYNRLLQPNELKDLFVYDDGIIKGMVKIEIGEKNIQISEFFVDPFFQKNGIGSFIINSIIQIGEKTHKPISLWVLDKNIKAIDFYKKFGFEYTNEKQEFDNSGFYMLKFKKNIYAS